jgi:hypothetical protein
MQSAHGAGRAFARLQPRRGEGRRAGATWTAAPRVARARGLALLADMDGHAGLEPFVREGYEIVVV